VNAGTVSGTAASTDLTGAGTAWDSSMVGSVIRLSASAKLAPTSLVGTNPAAFETVVAAVVSATELTLSDPLPATFSGVKYEISDPIDIRVEVMENAFLACVELHIARVRNMIKEMPTILGFYQQQLALARQQDSVSFMGRTVGLQGPYYQRLARMPFNPNA